MPKHSMQAIVAAKEPTRVFFDPYNSSATGHQRADNRLGQSTAWRDSRATKLASQLRDGERGGAARMFDQVGAGSKHFGLDGRLPNGGWARGASGLRTGGQRSIQDAFAKKDASADAEGDATGCKLGVNKLRQERTDIGNRSPDDAAEGRTKSHAGQPQMRTEMKDGIVSVTSPRSTSGQPMQHGDITTHLGRPCPTETLPQEPQIFRGLTIYLNGSTQPYVSDHHLRKLLAERGANVALALSRRKVTHVILGAVAEVGTGAGGGLAGGKLQKEVSKIKVPGARYVSVHWALDSIHAGVRLPESRFAAVSIAPRGQGSVRGMLQSAPASAASK